MKWLHRSLEEQIKNEGFDAHDTFVLSPGDYTEADFSGFTGRVLFEIVQMAEGAVVVRLWQMGVQKGRKA